MRYRATVVDLVPGVDDEKRAAECSADAVADTVEAAEEAAIADSAVNCDRRVYVTEDAAPFRIVKGPYLLRAKRPLSRSTE